MEKEQNNKVVYKESNSHCVANLKSKCKTKSFSNSTTKWITYFYPAGIKSKKPSRIPSSGPSDHPSSSPSVAMSMNPSPLPIIASTTLPSDIPNEKPIMLLL